MAITEFDYDLFVIGGGSGGVRAARAVAAMGYRVGIAEERRYGGTCVIRGCVPKKLMVYASRFREAFADAAGYGWSVGERHFDWSRLIAAKDREISRLEGLYRAGLERAGADVFDSRATLEGRGLVLLADGNKRISAKKVLVAVGGKPARLTDVPGEELCITSDDVFRLEEMPRSIVIFGGGYIAVEFACIFAGLGVKTTLAYRGDRILRRFDGDIRTVAQEEIEKKGVRVLCGALPESVSCNGGAGLRVLLNNGVSLNVDQAMLAVGRKPLTENLGLEAAGVERDRSGYIVVGKYSNTNIDGIWAVGDVTNRIQLTPVAIHEAMCFAETEFNDNPVVPDHGLVATAVFSQPEIGVIGLSEERASELYGGLDIFLKKFHPMKHALSGRNEKAMMKIIASKEDGKVLGVHIIGEGASEMVQILAIALKSGATKEEFDRAMAVHPTASEELVTMYEPAYQVINGKRNDGNRQY